MLPGLELLLSCTYLPSMPMAGARLTGAHVMSPTRALLMSAGLG